MAEETGQPQETQETVERPEYIPEKFWDTDRSEVNVEALGSSYKALESKLGQRTDELSKSIREDMINETQQNVPTEGYDLVTPEMPEGVNVNLDAELPIVKWWGEFASNKGLSQDEFNNGVNAFVENAVADIPNEKAEIEALGDNGNERVEAVEMFAKKNHSPENYERISNMATTAENIVALESLMNLAKDVPMPKEGMAVDVAPSENDLRSMMRDPRYWDDARKDQGYIDRVTTLYEKKYGTEPAKL